MEERKERVSDVFSFLERVSGGTLERRTLMFAGLCVFYSCLGCVAVRDSRLVVCW